MKKIISIILIFTIIGCGTNVNKSKHKKEPKYKGIKLSSWIKKLNHEDELIRIRAIEALGEIGDKKAVQPLYEIFVDENNLDIGDYAASALVKIGKPALPMFLKALEHTNEEVRGMALFYLGKLGDKSAIPKILIALGKEGDSPLVLLGNEALEKLSDKSTIPIYVNALDDENDFIRFHCILQLAEIDAYIAIPKIITMIEDKSEMVRETAVSGLEMLLGQNCGKDSDKWLKYWNENKERLLKDDVEKTSNNN